MAHRPSSIDQIPEEARELIGKLRAQGRTIDEILAHLTTMDVEVSRSALGRHVKGMAALQERMRSSREMALALADRFGDQPDNKLQRLNIEMLHGIVLQTMSATEDNEDGEPQPVTFDPSSVKALAQALAQLASAEKIDQERTIKARAEMAREAVAAVDKVAKREGGLTKDTIASIRAEILGIK